MELGGEEALRLNEVYIESFFIIFYNCSVFWYVYEGIPIKNQRKMLRAILKIQPYLPKGLFSLEISWK